MHNLIIQVSLTPVANDDLFTEVRYFDSFVGSIADYVDEVTPEDGILALERAFGDVLDINAEEKSFVVKSRETFFRKAFPAFRQAIATLDAMSYPEFRDGGINADLNVLSLNDAYDEKYGTYFDSEDEGVQTASEFLRMARDGEKYYIGAVIDYHV